MQDVSEFAKQISEDLWYRFRAVALVLKQSDRFVGMTPAGEAVGQTESDWLGGLAKQSRETDAVARELVLRAFHTASDPSYYEILKEVYQHAATSLPHLSEVCGLHRVPLSERVNDLVQAGLLTKDVQTGQVQLTSAADALMALLEATQTGLAELIRCKISEI